MSVRKLHTEQRGHLTPKGAQPKSSPASYHSSMKDQKQVAAPASTSKRQKGANT